MRKIGVTAKGRINLRYSYNHSCMYYLNIGSLDVLNGYEGEDIELKLPDDLTVYDIEWLSVWCITYKHDFGHVKIPKHDLNVPPSLDKFKIKKVTCKKTCFLK